MINSTIDKAICHIGGSNGKRATITIGEVKGMIENQNDTDELGESITNCTAIKLKIIGIVMGKTNCCVSWSLSTAEPTAANRAAYKK